MADPIWTDGVTPLNSVNMTKLQTRDEKNAPSGYVGLTAGNLAVTTGHVIVDPNLAGYKVLFGNAGDTNLYRSGAGTLKTDSSLVSGGQFYANTFARANATSAGNEVILGLNNSSFTAGPYIAFGTNGSWDTNLYRSASGQLKTDGVFFAGGAIASGVGTAGQIQITSGASPSVIFGPAGDANLLRYAANWLVTNGNFSAGWATAPGTSAIGAFASGDGWARVGLYNDGYIRWSPGNAGYDTDLYRGGAAALATSGEMSFGKRLIVNSAQPSTNWVLVGQQGGGLGQPAITFGTDTPLYRASAGVLITDGVFGAKGSVYSAQGLTNQITMHSDGKLYFGSASDTWLSRISAGVLGVNGVPIGGGGTRGQNTVTFSGAPTSAQVTFAHGLGVTPTNIQLTSKSGIGYCLLYVVSADATNITVEGRDSADAARTGTNGFYWVASP